MAQQVQIKRLKVWYDEKNYAWTQYSKMFGFYKFEKFVKGKPFYKSEHEEGAYAIWYDEKRNWCLGLSSYLDEKKWKCRFHAGGKGDDIYPTDTGYSFSECLIFHLNFLMIYIDLHRFYQNVL